jgi:hypothetical protein
MERAYTRASGRVNRCRRFARGEQPAVHLCVAGGHPARRELPRIRRAVGIVSVISASTAEIARPAGRVVGDEDAAASGGQRQPSTAVATTGTLCAIAVTAVCDTPRPRGNDTTPARRQGPTRRQPTGSRSAEVERGDSRAGARQRPAAEQVAGTGSRSRAAPRARSGPSRVRAPGEDQPRSRQPAGAPSGWSARSPSRPNGPGRAAGEVSAMPRRPGVGETRPRAPGRGASRPARRPGQRIALLAGGQRNVAVSGLARARARTYARGRVGVGQPRAKPALRRSHAYWGLGAASQTSNSSSASWSGVAPGVASPIRTRETTPGRECPHQPDGASERPLQLRDTRATSIGVKPCKRVIRPVGQL